MQPEVDIVVPVGPGDRAWHGLLPQLVMANANCIILVLAEDDLCENQETLNKSSFQHRLKSSSALDLQSQEQELDPGLRRDDEQKIIRPCPNEMPANLQVCRSKPGRAIQLNTGARASESAWIWFVHADSRVTPATLQAMHAFVRDNATAIGYFRLRFLRDGPRATLLNAWGAHFRSRFLQLPFGDQGLLMPRRVFDSLGGFNETVSTGEDHDLVWAARSRGFELRPVSAPIFTSARKYAEQGWWRTTCQHLGMTRDQARSFSRSHGRHDSVGPS